MIRVGLAGWGDHDTLYPAGTRPQDKLRLYGRLWSVVEVDSAFYALQPPERYAAWAADTPADFRFVVKAYQDLTGHQRGRPATTGEALDAVFAAFRASIEPLRAAGKLTAVLFQYPPWFDCTQANVQMLRTAKERMAGIPCALEFRHRSWFEPAFRDKTLAFMAREGWFHSVCDEPDAGPGSVPTVLQATDPDVTIVRFHGRNAADWNGGGGANWRAVRYLYDYSAQELAEWADRLRELERQSREVCVIFNNNSGGHAAGNAASLLRLLGQPVPALPERPQQLELFGESTP